MALTAGTRLGPYEIQAPLGAGGMGEVYRARDMRLKRDVALKILPETVASDADRLARFEREAQALAAVNHPNIAAIHGIEESAATRALVMELVEGETLGERLARGALPLGDALSIAQQIADALEAAHEAGIIHRDLKPANIKLRADGTVKVLDFGLAKALESPTKLAGQTALPTVAGPAMTHAGIILGTAAYMSPEQARGGVVGKRTDIWAFGCVLYEMLTGRPAFEGDTATDVLAAIVHNSPDWSRLTRLPRHVVRTLQRCLEKDQRRRIADIADVRLELESPAAPDERGQDRERSRFAGKLLAWTAAGVGVAGVTLALWTLLGREESTPRAAYVQIGLPPGVHLAVDTEHPAIALSPDGSVIAFIGDAGGTRRLYLRKLDRPDAQAVPGSAAAASPFFSPDGASVGVLIDYALSKVAVAGGVPMRLVVTPGFVVNHGATWLANGDVVVAPSVNSGLARAPFGGGELQPISALELFTASSRPYAWPSALPGSDRVLFTDNSPGGPRVAIAEVGKGNITPIINGASFARYSPTGHIVFARDGALHAARFDVASGRVTGAERKLTDGTMTHATGAAQFSVAAGGVLAYIAGAYTTNRQELVWVDRGGNVELLTDSRTTFQGPAFSPDGKQLAVSSWDGANLDVWRLDLARGTLARVTSHSGEDFEPTWSPDGATMAIASEIGEDQGEAGPGLAWIREGGVLERLVRSPAFGDWEFPSSWSPDGKWIAYVRTRGGPVESDVMVLPTTGPREPVAFATTPARETAPMFSPDGRHIAFVSDESGRPEVYIAPFPGPGARVQISASGGTEPLWARDGRELFYRDTNKLMAVTVGSGSNVLGAPRLMFEGPFERGKGMGSDRANYAISPDGRRFVMVRRKEHVAPTTIQVVFNWPEVFGVSSDRRD